MVKASKASLLVAAAMGLVALPCCADPLLAPGYGLDLFSLGTMPGTNGTVYGGLGFSSDGDNLLLAAYSAPVPTENIYSASVIRNASGQITGFGAVTSFSVSLTDDFTFGNAVAGGLAFLPNGTFLYTTATEDYIGQFANGVSSLTQVSDPNDNSAILGGMGYLPVGNSTQLVASFTNGDWFRVTATPDGLSPFYFIQLGPQLISGLPANSFAYSPEVTASLGGGVLVGDVSKATLALYGLAPNGNLLDVTTGVTLLYGNGEGIGYGVVVDPRTGNVILTGSKSDLWEILTPTPEPATMACVAAAIAVMLALYRRRRATGSKA